MFLYELMSLVGYFLFMIIFLVIAFLTAKKKSSWIWFSIGSVIQLLSLIGNQKAANLVGMSTTLDWVFYFVLLIGTAIYISKRQKNAGEEDK